MLRDRDGHPRTTPAAVRVLTTSPSGLNPTVVMGVIVFQRRPDRLARGRVPEPGRMVGTSGDDGTGCRD